jgi:hypothetical protein
VSEYPNWFELQAQKVFEQILPEFKGRDVNFLQIGAYTGDATEWLLKNVIKTSKLSTLTDVDTWAGSDEEIHKTFDWDALESYYTDRFKTEIDNGSLKKIKTTSDKFFARNKDFYDFIYVDGDHTALGTLRDGINAYDFLKVGGILAFDDYIWEPNFPQHLTPKAAIDSIRGILSDRLEVIHIGYQVWFRKIA